MDMQDCSDVSIPFKREGLPEQIIANIPTDRETEFLFPSNGKDFQNLPPWWELGLKSHKVSIPFKREGLPEQHPLRTQSQ